VGITENIKIMAPQSGSLLKSWTFRDC